jgi:mono/diheme cytochrome c family protein
VNAQEKEAYLREYYILKSQGKPFFPYVVFKDGAMATIVMIVIVLMAIFLGAELGPKADPTSTTYTPRPEWYYFFLFEVLRVVKPPSLVFIATVGIPTVCMVLLVLLPFIDRNPNRHPFQRPVAMVAGILTIAAMAYLTILGAVAGSPTDIEMKVAPQYEEGKEVTASSGCLGCHQIGHNGNPGPGPPLTEIGSRLGRQALARTLLNPTPPMPPFTALQQDNPEKFDKMVDFLASLK